MNKLAYSLYNTNCELVKIATEVYGGVGREEAIRKIKAMDKNVPQVLKDKSLPLVSYNPTSGIYLDQGGYYLQDKPLTDLSFRKKLLRAGYGADIIEGIRQGKGNKVNWKQVGRGALRTGGLYGGLASTALGGKYLYDKLNNNDDVDA